jgi:hypothetical protein
MLKLRPHHLLDIVTDYGHGREFQPHPYGHAVHLVANAVLADLELEVQFVVGADDICRPCKHHQPDGQCDDVVGGVSPPLSKQKYNDAQDRKLLACFGFPEGTVMTARQYFQIVNRNVPGLEKLCTHPGESSHDRLKGLEQGLRKLGVRPATAG